MTTTAQRALDSLNLDAYVFDPNFLQLGQALASKGAHVTAVARGRQHDLSKFADAIGGNWNAPLPKEFPSGQATTSAVLAEVFGRDGDIVGSEWVLARNAFEMTEDYLDNAIIKFAVDVHGDFTGFIRDFVSHQLVIARGRSMFEKDAGEATAFAFQVCDGDAWLVLRASV